MKLKITVLTVAAMVFFAGSVVMAEENIAADEMIVMDEGQADVAVVPEAINVGNKICPISGAPAGSMEEGATVEHEGKIYNLCCLGCAKAFKEDPEAAIQKIAEELAGSAE